MLDGDDGKKVAGVRASEHYLGDSVGKEQLLESKVDSHRAHVPTMARWHAFMSSIFSCQNELLQLHHRFRP